MIITFLLVIGVIAGVILIVVPQIGGTVRELTKSAEAFFPKVQKWAEDMFSNNTQIHDWIASLQFNTDKLMDTAINFLQNGAGNVLNGTFTAAKAVVSGITAFFIGL